MQRFFICLVVLAALAAGASQPYIALRFTTTFNALSDLCALAAQVNQRFGTAMVAQNLTLTTRNMSGVFVQNLTNLDVAQLSSMAGTSCDVGLQWYVPPATTARPSTTTVVPTSTIQTATTTNATSTATSPNSTATTTSASPLTSTNPSGNNSTTTATSSSTTDAPTSTSPTVAPSSTDVPTTMTPPNTTNATAVTAPSNASTTAASPAAARRLALELAANDTTTSASPNSTSAVSTAAPSITTTTSSAAPTTGQNSTSTPAPTNPNVTSSVVTTVFSFGASSASQVIVTENWFLSLEAATSASLGIVSSQYMSTTAATPKAIPEADLVTTPVSPNPAAQGYTMILRLTELHRYRLPDGSVLPWNLNRPHIGTIWQSLAVQLLIPLGIVADASSVSRMINGAAQTFPTSWIDGHGDYTLIQSYEEINTYSQSMFACTSAYIASVDENGYVCWFRVNDTSGVVLRNLNSTQVRTTVVNGIGGAIDLQLVPPSVWAASPDGFIMSFSERANKAKSAYVDEKGLFAVGLAVVFVVGLVTLIFLWVWTGSGRTIK